MKCLRRSPPPKPQEEVAMDRPEANSYLGEESVRVALGATRILRHTLRAICEVRVLGLGGAARECGHSLTLRSRRDRRSCGGLHYVEDAGYVAYAERFHEDKRGPQLYRFLHHLTTSAAGDHHDGGHRLQLANLL